MLPSLFINVINSFSLAAHFHFTVNFVLCPTEFYSPKYFVIFSLRRIKSYLYLISALLVEMRFLFTYIKKKNAKLFFFWWFKMKCNQTVKYSNKRGILDKSCHLRYINSVYDQSEFSCLAFSAIIVMSFSSFVAHKK